MGTPNILVRWAVGAGRKFSVYVICVGLILHISLFVVLYLCYLMGASLHPAAAGRSKDPPTLKLRPVKKDTQKNRSTLQGLRTAAVFWVAWLLLVLCVKGRAWESAVMGLGNSDRGV